MTTSTKAVAVALIVDFAIGAAKAVALLLTGSTAIMAELLHSLADITTQLLLVVGIVHSGREPDADYPYGFGRSRYIWAMLSAAGVLFVGSGISVIRGAQQVLAPEPLHHLGWGFTVLLFSLAMETASLTIGLSAVRRSARTSDQSVGQYLRSGPDPMGVAVVLEDSSAVLGILIALAGLGLAELAGKPAWDGVGSIGVGILLGVTAVFLINRNRRFLLGVAPPSEAIERMVAVLEQNPVIQRIHDVKVSQLGADEVRFKAEVAFDGRALARRLLAARDLDSTWGALDGPRALEHLLIEFGAEVTDAIGEEVDRIEERLTEAAPEARHVDLEPD
ncbi:MAG: cation diffusion facilitator family transporter [Polyangiales bacterium]